MTGGKSAAQKDKSPYSFVPHTQYALQLSSQRGGSDKQLYMKIKQHPERARAYSGVFNEKAGDRRPLDPPPVAQLLLKNRRTGKHYIDVLHNPYYMCYASLWHAERDEEVVAATEDNNGRGRTLLMGTVVTSMARLKDTDNVDGAFFPFCNLVVAVEGKFRILFTVFEINGGAVHCRGKTCTNVFTVYGKAFPGVGESTALCRVFAEQGVRLRLRKEPKLRRTKALIRPVAPICEVPKKPVKRKSAPCLAAAPPTGASRKRIASLTETAIRNRQSTNEAAAVRRASLPEVRPPVIYTGDPCLTAGTRNGQDLPANNKTMDPAATLPSPSVLWPSHRATSWSIQLPSPHFFPPALCSPASEIDAPLSGTMSDVSRSPVCCERSISLIASGTGRSVSETSCIPSVSAPASASVSAPTLSSAPAPLPRQRKMVNRISIDCLINCIESSPGSGRRLSRDEEFAGKLSPQQQMNHCDQKQPQPPGEEDRSRDAAGLGERSPRSLAKTGPPPPPLPLLQRHPPILHRPYLYHPHVDSQVCPYASSSSDSASAFSPFASRDDAAAFPSTSATRTYYDTHQQQLRRHEYRTMYSMPPSASTSYAERNEPLAPHFGPSSDTHHHLHQAYAGGAAKMYSHLYINSPVRSPRPSYTLPSIITTLFAVATDATIVASTATTASACLPPPSAEHQQRPYKPPHISSFESNGL
ncbi:hypothetical protein PhCBS80983_g04410 [Powellomyces hirtus]|uniref:Velvet domain-containing protein n=1 Tax=Powellomyces hirtus TaxID=109895 RepID=A0A507DYK4_9FUNG|nr:hypothetical protein PhCBS80983_g04410 [Powellomyces hirtus]